MAWSVVNVALQLSDLVGAVHVTVFPQTVAVEAVFCVILAGTPDMTGAMLSTMVTVNDPVAVLPDGSVTV